MDIREQHAAFGTFETQVLLPLPSAQQTLEQGR